MAGGGAAAHLEDVRPGPEVILAAVQLRGSFLQGGLMRLPRGLCRSHEGSGFNRRG